MSEYKNYNNYELKESSPVTEKKPDFSADDYRSADYSSTNGGENGAETPAANGARYERGAYSGANANRASNGNQSDVFGLISVILAPLSCCCCGLPAVVGIVLSIIGLKKNSSSFLSRVGLILCILAVIYAAYSIYNFVTNPELYQELLEQNMSMMEGLSETAGAIFTRK